MDHSNRSMAVIIFNHLGALIASVVVYFILSMIVSFLLFLSNKYINIGGESFFESIIRNIASPAIAGFYGIKTAQKLFSLASRKFIFLSFSAMLLITTGAYLVLVGISKDATGIPMYSFLMGFVAFPLGILGAFMAYKSETINDLN